MWLCLAVTTVSAQTQTHTCLQNGKVANEEKWFSDSCASMVYLLVLFCRCGIVDCRSGGEGEYMAPVAVSPDIVNTNLRFLLFGFFLHSNGSNRSELVR